jgi:hypothetical protein
MNTETVGLATFLSFRTSAYEPQASSDETASHGLPTELCALNPFKELNLGFASCCACDIV